MITKEEIAKIRRMIESADFEMQILGYHIIAGKRINRQIGKGAFKKLVRSHFNQHEQKNIRRVLHNTAISM